MPAIMYVFKTEKVFELLYKGNGFGIGIQLRNNVITLEYGSVILELPTLCPPFCP